MAFLLLAGIAFHIFRSNTLVFQRTSELREAIAQRDRVAQIARSSLKRLNNLEKRGILAELSNMFAHELKQPLSTVVNYANGLLLYGKTNDLDPTIKKALLSIVSESSKAVEIVNKVRGYAKSQTVRQDKSVDLIESVNKALSAFHLYKDNNSNVTFEHPQTPVLVLGDPLELEILVLNLLRNSAEAVSSEGKEGKIKVSIEKSSDEWMLSVEDNGPEISLEKLEDMKKNMLQSVKADGLGLGLMIVYAIVERHKSRIDISRIKPHGLKTSVYFAGTK